MLSYFCYFFRENQTEGNVKPAESRLGGGCIHRLRESGQGSLFQALGQLGKSKKRAGDGQGQSLEQARSRQRSFLRERIKLPKVEKN